MTMRKVAGMIGWYAAMAIVTVLIAGPVFFIVISAFKPGSELAGTSSLLPEVWTLQNFQDLFEITPMVRMLVNTAVVSVATVVICVVTGSAAAYALVRMRFVGRGPFVRGVLIAYMFPPVLIVVPLYVQMNTLGLVDSLVGLVLAFTSIALPFSIWMMMSFFQGLPPEVEEAAAIDGCTTWRTFVSVVVPMSKPGIAATCAATFMLAWGEYIFSITLVSDDDQRTVVAGLNALIGNVGLDYGLMFAGSAVAIVVPLLVFVVFQRWIVSGMTAGAVKG